MQPTWVAFHHNKLLPALVRTVPEASSCWRPYAPPRDVDPQCLSLSAPFSALAWKGSAPGIPPPQHPSRQAADVMSVTAATGGGLPPPPLPRGKVISPTAPRIAYLYSAPLIQRTTKGAIPVEPLDVTKERMQLKRVMHESNRQVVWSQAVATISNFRNGVTMGEWERLEAGGCGAVGFTSAANACVSEQGVEPSTSQATASQGSSRSRTNLVPCTC